MTEPVLVSTEINKFKLNKDAYMGVLEEISHYQPKSTPPPPEELVKYRAFPEKQRRIEAGTFFAQDFIAEYMNLKWLNELYNESCFRRLYELLQKEPENKHQIIMKLNQFKAVILQQDHPFQALRINFNDYQFVGEKAKGYDELDSWMD